MKATHSPGFVDHLWDENVSYEEERAITTNSQGKFDVVTEPSGQKRFWFVCPGPCKAVSAIALRPVIDGSQQSWEWNGSLEAPTLQPSINHIGCWHGWLTNGEFISC